MLIRMNPDALKYNDIYLNSLEDILLYLISFLIFEVLKFIYFRKYSQYAYFLSSLYILLTRVLLNKLQ